MSSVVIHNDNVANIELFEHSIKFVSNSVNVDMIIDNVLQELQGINDLDVVYIKDNLTSSYLEFVGLRVAYHIRLSKTLGEARFLPIVILSELDIYSLNKVEPTANILFTKNIFLLENRQEAIKNFNTSKITALCSQEEQVLLENISVLPPKDYLSHHSITNEWAIDQWAYLLDVNSEAVINNRKKIAYMLYYKYIKVKYHLEDKTVYTNKKPTRHKGRVLFIDDRVEDGWGDVLTTYTQKFYTDVELYLLNGITKDTTVDDIKQFVASHIEEYNPDIIILDLRLLHNEESDKKINKISGYQILQYIKKLNPSIQIIMFTASSDSSILEELYKQNILGYIKKDSPLEKYVASKSSFSKLDKLIKSALDKKYLKEIYRISMQIESLNIVNSCQKEKKTIMLEIQNSVSQVFEILNSNIANSFLYAMYSINKTLELIINFYIEEKYRDGERKAIWIESNKQVNLDYNSTENKLFAILKEKLSINSETVMQNIHKIICCRNYNIHGGEEKRHCINGLIKKPNNQDLIEWFDIIYTIIKQLKANI